MNISNNIVYMAVKQTPTYNNESHSICPIQFIGAGNRDNIGVLKYEILILNNIPVHRISRNLQNEGLYFDNCTGFLAQHSKWLMQMMYLKKY